MLALCHLSVYCLDARDILSWLVMARICALVWISECGAMSVILAS